MQQIAHKQQTSWGGLVFLLVVLVVLGYAGWAIYNWLEDEQRVPVEQVLLGGERKYIDDEQVRHIVRTRHSGSFFNLDVDDVHRDLEALPWVYRASVRKRWPNSLNIYLVEQVAAASWNQNLLLNQFGDSYNAQAVGLSLPALFGPMGTEKTVLQAYKAMQLLLNEAELQISELTLSERFAWNVTLTNGVTLNLGRTEFVNRLQRFVDLYPLLRQQPKQIEYVDLRYDTGLAVGWKAAESETENKQSERA